MSSRYPKAVGHQPSSPQLGRSWFYAAADYQPPAPLRRASWTDAYWNAGVNMAYGRPVTPPPVAAITPVAHASRATITPGRGRQAKRWRPWGPPQVGIDAYNLAQTQLLYGNMDAAQAELGDLFNDIMGAVVPGWANRPQALKNIVLKPDPNKIVETAQRIAPNAAHDILKAANANGLQVYVNTPGGQVTVTPENAQLYYGNYQFMTKAQGMVSGALGAVASIPMGIWLALGAGALALFAFRKA